uniref:Zinc finger PHD-type domain-containing protein n=1 Tax=Arundo donax TaxID=35708 RepID=A0A0A9CKF7_ARUDO
MKGGRLHRPEPQAHLVAAAAPAPAPGPSPAPTDDWVDGSWTVDCSCGVTFDDGEEMVSCDECNVWVHTRCARYVRGLHTSFSCHKCRSKRAPSSTDEAEVAELLAELPTHRPPPLYRRWAEVPLPSRVHVHGLPGGGDAALFRGVPAFSAALWRCTGYVPKRFGFRYCEFPSWADEKDNGADALFALAREKHRETADAIPIVGAEPKKEKHYIRSLSCRGKKSDGGQHTVPPLTESKKREPDTWEDGCQQREGRAVPDAVHEDDYAKANMASSDLHAVYTKKKMEESLERSVDKKCPKEIPGMLNKDEQKESLKLEASGIMTTSSVAEQELHSGFISVEISMCKQQAERNHNTGLKSGAMNSVHAGPNKMHGLQGLQKLSNQTSNLQDVAGVPDLQIVQSKSHIIKAEPSSQENEMVDAIQLVSDGHKSDKQVLGAAAASSIVQRNSSKLTYDLVCCEHPKSETENPMHTVAEHPNSLSGVTKICKSFSGSISIPCELSHSLVSKEPSSTRNADRLTKKELVSPTDSKHDSARFSEESSQEVTRCSEKVQLKGSLPSAPKSSHKPRLPVSKEQSQKTATTGSTSARSIYGEVPQLQSRNKAVPSNSSHKKDKVHQRTIHVTQEGSNNSTSTELRASDSTVSLSDEQLALLLHQQLNSSPRVPRVPRCHQASGTQMLHQTGATVFSKRSSAHGGRDYGTVLKKRNREDVLKDNEDTKRTEKSSFLERRQRDSSAEYVSSVMDSCRFAENIASEQISRGVCSTGANTALAKADTMDSSVSRSIPRLIDEIISKNGNITYGELCDAINEHFRDLRKPNEEDCSYPSYLNAVDDCLRKRREWAHLVDQAHKTNSNKRRKGESDSLLADVLEADNMKNGPERDSEEGSADLHQEDLPRGKRKARKLRRLELKGRRVRDTRKRSSIDSSSEDAAATLSDSSSDRNDTPMDGVNQDDNSVASRTGAYMEAKSADSSS